MWMFLFLASFPPLQSSPACVSPAGGGGDCEVLGGTLAQLPLGLNASLLLMPQGHFISFARTKETKQRRVVEDYVRKKFAVCTFWATPASVSAKQKELASLKQLFVFNAPTLTSASRPKSEAGPFRFFCATSLRSLGVWCLLLFSCSLRWVFVMQRLEKVFMMKLFCCLCVCFKWK